MSVHPLLPRMLPRLERLMAPVVWQLTPSSLERYEAERLLFCAAAAGADWIVLPADLDEEAMAKVAQLLPPTCHVIVELNGEHLQSRVRRPVENWLKVLGREQCDAVLLQGTSPSQIKGGTPLHRLSQLRDAGRIELVFVEAADAVAGQWMVEHTAAHAVVVPFGVLEQTAGFALLPAAAEVGTGILARRPAQPAWQCPVSFTVEEDIAFCLSHATITAVLTELPGTLEGLRAVLEAASRPMREAERLSWWAHFQEQVPPPEQPRGGHPPEYGA